MQNKKLLKLGIIVSTTVITTALLIGCENAPDTVQTIHVSPTANITYEEPIEAVIPKDAEEDIEISDGIEEKKVEDENNPLSELTKVTVSRVVDGDTYVVNLNGEETKIRLIGVDTPESVASEAYLAQSGKENTEEGKAVSDIMKETLPEGTTLYLEFDVSMYDKYDRVLAYAYFEDGEMVQDFLLSQGYAKVMTIEPNVAYSEHFVQMEQKAMGEGVGLWADYEDLFDKEKEYDE